MPKVRCQICGGDFVSLFPAHLKKHGINKEIYELMFPGCPIWSDELHKKRSASATRVNTGRELSDESKRKISSSLLGHLDSEETRFRKHASHLGLPTAADQGKGTNKYGSGFTTFVKRRVLIRDNYCCQEFDCPGTSSNLTIHHLDFEQKNNDMCNLITLCKSCHTAIHWLMKKRIDDAEIIEAADRVFRLSNGRLVEKG